MAAAVVNTMEAFVSSTSARPIRPVLDKLDRMHALMRCRLELLDIGLKRLDIDLTKAISELAVKFDEMERAEKRLDSVVHWLEVALFCGLVFAYIA